MNTDSSVLGRHDAYERVNNLLTVDLQGQGANQHRLKYYCEYDSIDITQIGFLDVFPDQSGGYLGTNFGNQCGDETFKNPDGSDSPLLSPLPTHRSRHQVLPRQGQDGSPINWWRQPH